ncbi:MAG: TerC family protein [Kiritimatiellia bacterium]
MDWISQPEAWAALATLTVLEIVLGIDNIVFLSILSGRLPAEQQQKARITGLALAMGMRILLLLGIQWIMKLTDPLFTVFHHAFSGKDLILGGGGLFLLVKGTTEIHHALEGADEEHASGGGAKAVFGAILFQIVMMDIIFSLDSVITAVAMAKKFLAVMILAVIIAVLVMMIFARALSEFIERHPTVKMLALSFLILIGVTLVAEAFHAEIPKQYIYFSMAFSITVEMLNIAARRRRAPVRLHKHISDGAAG